MTSNPNEELIAELRRKAADARKLSLVAERTDNAVLITNAAGFTEWLNPGFVRMTGYEIEEVLGMKPGQFLQGPETSRETVQMMSAAIKAGQGFQTEILNYKKNGERFWLAIDVQPIFDEHGTLTNFIAIESDITERKRKEAERERLLADLSRVNRELNDFAHIVSHDLKAPLRGVTFLASRILKDYGEVLGEDGRGRLETLQGRIKDMHSMIGAVLAYSRADAAPQNPDSVALSEVVYDVIGLLDPPDSLRVDVAGGMPVLHVSRVQIHQVFQNLLSNAFRFVHPETGVVTVECSRSGGAWVFAVSDNGPGIPESLQKNIFRIFQKTSNGGENSGVGLAITKKLIEKMGGSIEVASVPGEGATFRFRLPCALEVQDPVFAQNSD